MIDASMTGIVHGDLFYFWFCVAIFDNEYNKNSSRKERSDNSTLNFIGAFVPYILPIYERKVVKRKILLFKQTKNKVCIPNNLSSLLFTSSNAHKATFSLLQESH